MRKATRRLLESIILIVTILVVVDLRGIWRGKASDDREAMKKLHKTLYQELLRMYSPGDTEAYWNLFPTREGARLPESGQAIDWYTLWEMLSVLNCSGGMPAVEEAPDWFHSELARAEVLTAALADILETGPYVPPPPLEHGDRVALSAIHRAAESLQVLARRDWAAGDYKSAIKRLMTIIRLGDSLEPHYSTAGQSTRSIVYRTAVSGFDALAWTEPGPKEDLLILAALEDVDSENWKIPPHTESILWYVSPYWGFSIETGQFSIDALSATLLLHREEHGQRDVETSRFIQEARIIPDGQLSGREIAARMSRWTTVPAMRRRARRIPDSYYQTDPWMSPVGAKELPPLLYLASRIEIPYRSYGDYLDDRLDLVRAKARVVEAAFRTRVWRDENARWPTPEEFAAMVGPGVPLTFHALTDPAPLLNEFAANRAPTNRPMPRQWGFDPKDPTVFHLPVLSHIKQRHRYLQRVKGIEPSEAEVARWLRGILEREPLVESATETKSALPDRPRLGDAAFVVTAHLRIPRRIYWVTDPGADGQHDGPAVSFDPVNGTTSRGDIVQLAGWEW